MAALQNKYQSLIQYAQTAGAQNLQIREQDNVLYIDGNVPSEAIKDQIWAVYNQIDPDYRTGDLVLNLVPAAGSASTQEYEVQKGDSLSKIGSKLGVAWKDIYEANKDQISNPDLIQPGWKLKIPSK